MVNITTKPILIPSINMATINMLCMQYDIPYATLQNRINYYKDEFENEFITPKSKAEFEALFPETTQFVWNKNTDGSFGYMFTNAAYASIKFGRTKLYSEKAVNDILRHVNEDGRKRNRPQNRPKSTQSVENVKATSKIQFDSEEEETLCLNLAKAYASGELMNVISAAMALDEYRKVTINGLKEKLHESEKTNLIPWTNRSTAKRLVNRLSEICGERPVRIWETIYYRIVHEYNIPLENRNKRPLINGLKDEEWSIFYQAFIDICKDRYMDAERIIRVSGIDIRGLMLTTKC